MKRKAGILTMCAALLLMATAAYATFNFFQGFEVDTVDWNASLAITRVASGGGTLGLTAASGGFYAELQNLHDGYSTGYGDGGYSFYGGADSVYHGAFFQAIDVYIDATWTPATVPGVPSFWIDMQPYNTGNTGAEHNFRLTATGAAVDVRVDDQVIPIATLTTSGWYTFVMSFRKAPLATDPVLTDMIVFDSTHAQVGTTTVDGTSPGGPFLSSDLFGNGYVWITAWQNGFASDVLGLDNQHTGLFPGGLFPPSCESDFRDVRRASEINCGPDLGGTGHAATNFTGSTGSAGDTWITVYDTTPADNTVQNTFGSVSLSADVLIHRFNNKKGAGLLALYNEGLGKKGLALIVYDNGNTDSLVLATVDQAGRLTPLKTVALDAGIAENKWYRVTMGVVVSDGSVTVTADVKKHTDPLSADSAVDGPVWATTPLTYSATLASLGLDATGEVGIIASAISAVVDTSVANFTITP